MNIGRRKIIGTICLMLSAAMLAAGCGEKTVQPAKTSSLSAAEEGKIYFRGTRSITDSELSGNIRSCRFRDGKFYFLTLSGYDDESAERNLYSCGMDGSGTSEIKLNASGEILCFNINSSGELVIITNDDEGKYHLLTCSADGSVKTDNDITEQLKDDYPVDIALDGIGNTYISCNYSNLRILDGELNVTADIECGYIDKMINSANGDVCIYSGDDQTRLHSVNAADGTLSDGIKISDDDYGYDSTPVDGFGGTDIFVSNGSALYSYDLETGEKIQILDWTESNVNISEANYVFPVSENEFAAAGCAASGSPTAVYDIHTIDPSEIVSKKTITLAGSDSTSQAFQAAAVAFNTSDPDYNISIKSYPAESYGNDINTEILAGNIPDMLITTSDVPYESYISKGIFADMYPMLDNEKDMSRSDFLPNILSAFETNGKLFRIPDSFELETVIGKSSLIGSASFSELEKLAEQYPDSEILPAETKDSILRYWLEMNAADYYDRENGKFNFNNESFIALLRFADKFPDKIDQDSYFDEGFWNRLDTMYAKNEALLMNSLISNYNNIFYFEKNNFGEAVTAAGFPSASGNTKAAFRCNYSLGISAASENIGGAWKFVKYILSEEYQDSIAYDFPIRISSLQKQAQKAMDKASPDSMYIIQMGDMALGSQFNSSKYGTPAQSDIDKVNDIINSAEREMYVNTDIAAIVTDEAAAYFAGTRSAEDTAAAIQSRADIYSSENR